MKKLNTQKLILLALFTAIVIILQLLGNFVRFGPFSVSLVLMPIVVGGALLGIAQGAWLGLVFGAVVLISGDANVFIAVNPAGAVITVLLKGMLAGFLSALFYKMFTKISDTVGTLFSALTCPIINTGIFIIGSYVFFIDALRQWGLAEGFTNVSAYLFIGVIGINFFLELGLNIILCPVIIRLVQYGQKTLKQ